MAPERSSWAFRIKIAVLSPDALNLLNTSCDGFVDYTLHLDYANWSANDIIQAVLPEDLREGAPVGFAATGHVAHMNLNDEYLPYKYVIGQVILDKNATIKTVVNKLDAIDTKFRVFRMECLAGDENYVVEHRESDCKFTFDFSKVYWNSRLHTEHGRLVDLLQPEDVLADVFAGVGPFALPAGKKGCGVFANDLNPRSFEYLEQNIKDNDVVDEVRPSCEDGREFIRTVFDRLLDNPFPAYTGPKASKTKERKMKKEAKKAGAAPPTAPSVSHLPPRNRIGHVVMNLPDSAITFLDALRGIFNDRHREVYTEMPLIHCYCFTRELEIGPAAKDITERVESTIGHPISEDVSFFHVRSVAPNKEMYCVTFRLPSHVAFGTE